MSTDTITLLPAEERQRLNDAFAVAQETGLKTIDFAAQRLQAVLTIGHTLNNWRGKVAHFQWGNWLQANIFPIAQVTERSLNNWMRLAKSEQEGRLKVEGGIGVRAALIQAGIIPANDKPLTSTEPKVKGDPATIQALVRLSFLIDRLNVVDLDEKQVHTIKAALQAFLRLNGRLAV